MGKIIETLSQIAESLSQYETNDIGLFSGMSGHALFELTYGDLVEKRYIPVGLSLLEKIFNSINSKTDTSFATGLSGVAWLLNYIKKKEWDYIDDIEFIINELDMCICASLNNFTNINYYDLLYGYIGIGHYLTERIPSNPKILNFIDVIIDKLAETAIYENGKIKWPSQLPNKSGNVFNISMSHGMSSIVIFLTNIYNIGYRKSFILPLISGAVKYILSQEIDFQKYNSYFPSLSLESNDKLSGSRLGWCYGDLGVCIALMKAGKITRNTIWLKKAFSILEYEANNRREVKLSSVYDACFCHGSVGIAHIYYKLWLETQIVSFRNAADYWYAVSLHINRTKDLSLGGYAFGRENNAESIKDYSMLNGITGIGLSLLYYNKNIIPDYDHCFML